MNILASTNSSDTIDGPVDFIFALFGFIGDLIGLVWTDLLWADSWQLRMGSWIAAIVATFFACAVLSAIAQGDEKAEGCIWTFGMGTVFVVGMFAIFIYTP